MRVLVTLLGKGRRDGDGAGRYLETDYGFPDGQVRRGAYFGLELAKVTVPDRVVILGTASSMWDVLVEDVVVDSLKDGQPMQELRLQLMLAVEEGVVDATLLDSLSPAIAQALGCDVLLRLIPAAITAEAQRDVLGLMAASTEGADKVSFDVTHGYRHLGMLGFLSAFAIERMRVGHPVQVEAIWYGAFEMKEAGVAPVVRLDGLLRIQQWVDALNRFDANGNYGIFAPLLAADGVSHEYTKCLGEAALLESNINLRGAAQKLQTVLARLDSPLPGASGLFQGRLRECIGWVKESSPSAQHFALARSALQREDYLRAGIMGFEGFLAGLAWKEKSDHCSFEVRGQLKDDFLKEQGNQKRADARQSLFTVRDLRNALAHGTPPDADAWMLLDGKRRKLRQVLAERELLHHALSTSIDTLERYLAQH